MPKTRIIAIFLIAVFFSTRSFADWYAFAIDKENAWAIVVNQPTKKRAESLVLKECAKQKTTTCKVVGSSSILGYVVVATSSNFVQVYRDEDLDSAKEAALDRCATKTSKNDTCTIAWTGVNGKVVENTKNISAADCRPRTREIRCKSNCVNGDCIVDYENNCKVRVQVPAKFDSHLNQWTYPSPSC
jgi:Domain of unknown function (DUF4189)